ncbi:MAG: PrsW family intramembrane metalloprotease [Polyangiaceae bacterium]|jgi:RsiW-degrading membrane proteinase PrsW (M82 family)
MAGYPMHPGGRPGYPQQGYGPQGQYSPQQQGYPPPQPPPMKKADPERSRKIAGIVLYVLGMLIGGVLLFAMFLIPPLFSKDPGLEYYAMGTGAVLALPPLVIYLWVPWVVDRYDPEPVWALTMCLLWGGIAACGFSALINTVVGGIAAGIAGPEAGDVVGACISAPVVEEFAKALAVFGVFYFARREFDGIVDGIVYATFAALGFAAIENIIYYGRAAKAELAMGHDGALAATFVIRGVLAPWGHPLYTSMTGIGFGIARETEKGWVKWFAPFAGYCGAVFLHCVWNTSATLSNMLPLLMLPLWFLFVIAFFGLLLWLVMRKGKIIRSNLEDEVLLGNLTPQELLLVTSPIAHIKATFSWGGAPGRRFVDAAARLALSKWHTGRATRARKATISADFVVPLRQDLAKYRGEMSQSLRRQLPQPQPWSPNQGPFRRP